MKKQRQPHGGALIRAEKGDRLNPKGRPKGSRNRATIARRILALKVDWTQFDFLDRTLLDEMGIQSKAEMEVLVTVAQVMQALRGSTPAYVALMDSAYGKVKQEADANHSGTVVEVIWAGAA